MTLDFSEQRLQGKSFRGQDLQGANFSRADLRGADFSQARLNRANFTAAKMGLVPLKKTVLLAIAFLVALLSGGLSSLLVRSLDLLLHPEYLGERSVLSVTVPGLGWSWVIPTPPLETVGVPLLMSLLSFWLLVALRVGLERANKLLLTSLVVIVIVVSMILAGYPDWGTALAIVGLALAIAAGLAQLVGVGVALTESLQGPVAGCGLVAIAVLAAWLLVPASVSDGVLAGIVLPLGAIALGVWMAWREVERGLYPEIRLGAVAIASRWGTRFYEADLTGADFTGALLHQSDLRRTGLTPTQLQGAERVEWAWKSEVGTQKSEIGSQSVRVLSTQDLVQPSDGRSAGEGDEGVERVNPEEVLASLMVLVRLAIADGQWEAAEQALLREALKVLALGETVTVEELLADETPMEELLARINSPIVREKVYQSAYLMARIDGELELAEETLLAQFQTHLGLTEGKVEKLKGLVEEAKDLSIVEQVEAITDPEQREAAVNTNIRLMACMHAFSGAMPIPGFAIVTHLMIYKDQVELVQKIGRIWGYPADYESPALNQALFGTVGATAARVALSNVALLIPVWGSVIGASTAFSMTWAIGELAQQYFASGGEMDETTLREQLALTKRLGLQVFEDYQEAIASKQQEVTALLQELQAGVLAGRLTQQEYWQQVRERLGSIAA